MLKNSSKLILMLAAVAALMLTASSSFARTAFNDPLIITDSVTVKSQIRPDIMTGGMSLIYKTQKSEDAAIAMEKAASVVRNFSPVCTFSGYSVNPEYVYKDGDRNLKGFTGTMDFECRFKDIGKYEPAVNAVYALAEKDSAYAVSMRPVRWQVSEILMDARKADLKLAALKAVFAANKKYSAGSGRICSVKEITFDSDSRQPVYREMSVRAVKSNMAVTAPDISDTKVSVTAQFSSACK